MTGPLDGFRILDLTRLQPGNYATMVLGDLGADVIKVEEPGRGDYMRWTPPMVGNMSAAHRVMNRNKRSVTLNLKKPRGAELLIEMAKQADGLIESFRPGVMERLGVGYETLAKANPRLVYAAITGYGQNGPYKSRAGHDINYLAISGILDKTGEAGGPPVLPGVQIADLSGAMMAVIGMLAGLLRSAKSSEGEFVDVSMLDTSVSWLALHVAPWFAGAGEMARGDSFLNGGFPFYRVYECSDRKFISVGALEPQFWGALVKALGHEDLVAEQMSVGDERERVHKRLEETFRSKTRDEWTEELAELDACVAPVKTFEEMAEDPQVKARKLVEPSPLPEAEGWRSLGPAVSLRRNPAQVTREAPELGEHNEEVLAELGLGDRETAELAAEGVI